MCTSFVKLHFWIIYIVLIFGCVSKQHQAFAIEAVTIPNGGYIDQLPGANILAGSASSLNISLVLTAADIQGANVSYRGPIYKAQNIDDAYLFGPTLRIKAGDTLTIKVTNNLTQSESTSSTMQNYFHNPGYTNLHTHGLHVTPGPLAQSDSLESFTGEDTPFLEIPAKQNESDEAQSLVYTRVIPVDHLPGMHWYHPHSHGSTALQTTTANGLIIIEDDPLWLPDSNGCTSIRTILASAPEIILHLALLAFKPPLGQTPLTTTAADNAQTLSAASAKEAYTVNANLQSLSALSDPANPLCCDDTAVESGQGALLSGSATNEDVLLVNGAAQPTIPLASGQYQRWRMVLTGYRRFVDLQILDAGSLQVTTSCELQLVGKDGLYLLQVPRTVNHIFLGPGNRAELLVKCIGDVGRKWVVTSGSATVSAVFDNPQDMMMDGNTMPGMNMPGMNMGRRLSTDGGDDLDSASARVPDSNGDGVADDTTTLNFNLKNNADGDVETQNNGSGPMGTTNSMSNGMMGGMGGSNDISHNQAVVAYLEITKAGGDPSPPLSQKSCTPLYPTYAPDLRDEALSDGGAVEAVTRSPVTFTMTMDGNCQVNNEAYAFPDANPIELPMGKVVHWEFQEVSHHVMHLHANPYQIVSLPAAPRLPYTSWFEVGDRHDTLLIPVINMKDAVGIRLQPGSIPGYSVLHCHMLQHEDTGCMKVTASTCDNTGFDPTQELTREECDRVQYPVVGTVDQAMGSEDKEDGAAGSQDNAVGNSSGGGSDVHSGGAVKCNFVYLLCMWGWLIVAIVVF